MSPYFSLNSISNSMVKKNSRKGVLAIAFLCLVTYLVAFPGVSEAVDYQLTVNVSDPPQNYVTIDWGTGVNTCSAASCNYTIPESSSVTLIPHADGAGSWLFTGWTGDVPGPNQWDMPYVFTITGNFVADAAFGWNGVKTLTVDADGTCSGSVHAGQGSSSGQGGGYASTFPYIFSYWNNEDVTLTAYPDTGCKFVKWAGDISSTNNPDIVTVATGTTVTATFDIAQYNLTTTASPAGSGLVTPSTTYLWNEGLWVSAMPNTGWQFVNWTGPGAGNLVDPNAAGTNLITPLFSDTDITANFAMIDYNLTTAQVGMGTVTPSTTYTFDDALALSANPDPTWGFVSWSGDTANLIVPNLANTALKKPLYSDTSVTANFGLLGWLQIDNPSFFGGTNNVTIEWGGNTINCGDWWCDPMSPVSPLLDIPEGASVTLTAVVGPMYAFTGWSGVVNGATNPITFTKGAGPEMARATFTNIPTTRLLTVDVINGKFQNNIKIDWPNNSFICDNICTYNVPDGTLVTLTPVADGSPPNYWMFDRWTGMVPLPNQNDNPYVFTITSDFAATANFVSNTWTFQLEVKDGVGQNSITMEYATTSVSCSALCIYQVPQNQTVTLTAIADPTNNWMFEDWKRDGSGTANPYLYTVNADLLAVDAHYKADGDYILTINASGGGSGSVTAGPGSMSGIGGGTITSFPTDLGYKTDDVLTLIPTPDAGSVFAGWSGDGYDSSPPADEWTVDMNNANRSVTANFTKKYDVTIADVGTVDENAGTVSFAVTVTPTVHVFDTVTVDYTTVNGSATAGQDYTATIGTLTFGGTQSTLMIDVPITNDTKVENAENFFVDLSNPSIGTTIVDNQGECTINADATDVYTININSPTANEDFGPAFFTVTVTQIGDIDVQLDYTTQDGTATTADSDYTLTSGTLVIPAGSLIDTIIVPVTSDTKVEPDETFTVRLSNIVGPGVFGTDTGTATLRNDDAYGVSIDDVTVSEADGTATFTVTLDQAGDVDVSMDYASADGSATVADNDYTAVSGTFTISAGAVNRIINVSILEDPKFEPDETFTVVLSNLSHALSVFTVDTGTGTITNNDYEVASVSNPVVAEGTQASFTITLDRVVAGGESVSIDYTTTDGSANAGSDYTAVSGTLTIAAGLDNGVVTVDTTHDVVVEIDEDFTLDLTNVGGPLDNVTLTANQGTATITNNDYAVASVSSPVVVEGNTASFTITLDRVVAGGESVSIDYTTTDGSANAGSDYTAVSGTLTIAAGLDNGVVTVDTTHDVAVEIDEDFTLDLINVGGPLDNVTLTANQGTATITNNDYAVTLVSNPVVVEGAQAQFSVRLDRAVAGGESVSIDYTTTDGSANAGSDYTAVSGTLTIPAGNISGIVSVDTTHDVAVEIDEDFTLDLTNVGGPLDNVTLTANQGTATITNNDYEVVSVSNPVVLEGNTASFTITLDRVVAGGESVSIDYTTTDGSANAGSDYTAVSGTLTIAAGLDNGVVTVDTTHDVAVEIDEDFTLDLTNVGGPLDNVTLTANQGTATITNNDYAVASVSNPVVVEGNTASFTITLDRVVAGGESVSIDYTTTDGSANAGSDYTAVSGTLTIAAGLDNGVVTVDTTHDVAVEIDEDFTLDLTNVGGPLDNVTLTANQGTGTITNNDYAVASVSNPVVVEGNQASFTITLDRVVAGGESVSIDYTTTDGSATAGSDYTAVSGTLTIAAGLDNGVVTVDTIHDVAVEIDEDFTLDLTNVGGPLDNVTLTANQGTATITDNDYAVASVSNPVVVEGNTASFTITLDRVVAGGESVSIDYTTTDGSANAGSDYTAVSGTLTIAAGLDNGVVTVDTTHDVAVEIDEDFTLDLTNVGGPLDNVTLTANQGTATITNNDYAVASVSNPVVVEGNTASFTITLDRVVAGGESVSIDYTTTDGSANAGSDYTAVSGTLTIAAGLDNGVVSVDTTHDVAVEIDEDFTLDLTNVGGPLDNVTLTANQGTATITNNDYEVVSVSNPVVVEGNTASFTITLDRIVAGGESVSIDYTTTDGSANAGSDYTAVSGTLTIAAGLDNGVVTVDTTHDVAVEIDEDFTLDLTNVGGPLDNVTLTANQGTATITNNDYAVASVSNPVVVEGNTASFNITLDRVVAGGESVSIDYTTTDGSANAGSDYTAVSGTLTIAAGLDNGVVTVDTTHDVAVEIDEDFTLDLTNVGGPLDNVTLTANQGTGTITNNDYEVVSVSNPVVVEGNQASFTVTLNGLVAGGDTVSINYTTTDGSANAGSDYTAVSGTLTIAAGLDNGVVTVDTTHDVAVEIDEDFTLDLTNVGGPLDNVTLTANQGTATITDNDYAVASVSNPVVVEGNTASFTITLDRIVAGGESVSIDYTTTDGSANAGSDYTAVSGTLTIAAGLDNGVVTVDTTHDVAVEIDEDFTLDLTNVGGPLDNVTLTANQGTATITNNDYEVVSVSNPVVLEGNTASFTITLDRVVAGGESVSIDYTTTDGSANAGSDYTAVSGTLTIAAGLDNGVVTVDTTHDVAVEIDEDFTLDLTNVGGPLDNVTLTANQGTATITNNDYAVVSVSNPVVVEGNTASFTITLDRVVAGGESVSIDYTTTDGSANAGSDYTAVSGTLTIAAGLDNGIVSVDTTHDVAVEIDEDFTLDLTNVGGPLDNVTLTANQGTATITNNDYAVISISNPVVFEGNTAQFTVTLDRMTLPAEWVNIDYTTTDGSATAGSDYTGISGTLAIGPNNIDGIISVATTDDAFIELDENFTLDLTNVGGPSDNADLTGVAQATATITDNDDYQISVDDVTVDEGAGTATFTVSLDQTGDVDVSVDYATSNGTAFEPGDYTAVSGTLLIAAGNINGTFAVPINDDIFVEFDETFTVTLSSVVGPGVLADANGTGTITNNDNYQISVDDVTVFEDAGTMTFTVSLDQAGVPDVSVDYATTDGTAAAPGDYTAVSGTLLITGGSFSGTFAVPINDDILIELSETFTVTLSSVAGPGVLADANGTGTITDNDGYAISIDDVTVAEDGGSATLTVSLDQIGALDVSVDYATADGSATQPGDYAATSGTLLFSAGLDSLTIIVPLVVDTVVEADEAFTVNLSNVVGPGWILDGSGTVTITNDDTYAISISDSTANEDFGPALFTVSVDQIGDVDVSVDYVTTDGSAVQPADYAATSGTLTIPAGSISGTISVPIVPDAVVEADETYTVGLSNIVTTGLGAFAKDTGIGTITNDDTYGISIDDQTVDEDSGSATFTVTLDAAGDVDVSVDYATANGSAVQPGDYTDTSGTLTISAGGTSGIITVPIIPDAVVESDETYTVGLSNIVTTGAGTFIKDTGNGIITNDDTYQIDIDDPVVNEDSGNAAFTVSLNLAGDVDVSVDYVTSDGSATQPGDYTLTSGTLTIPAGSNNGIINVPLVVDTIVEADENFRMTLSNIVTTGLAAFIKDIGTGTITNDDTYQISIDDQTVDEDSGNATFTVSLDQAGDVDVSVDYASADGTAVQPGDYTAVSGTLNIAAGSNSGTITVPIIADAVVESDETYTVGLSNIVTTGLGAFTKGIGIGTITNDDTYQISIDDQTVDEDSGSATFTVTLLVAGDVDVSVDYATTDGSAVQPVDYTDTSGTLTISAGGTSGIITVPIIPDAVVESDETYTVALSNIVTTGLGAFTKDTGNGIITNDDTYQISIDDPVVDEDNGNMAFTVTLLAAGDVDVSVDYTTSDGSATQPADYTLTSGTLTIPAGSNSGIINVPLVVNTIVEADETFSMTLSNIVTTGLAAFIKDTGTGTITNDDTYQISIDDPAAAEDSGNATFTVSLDQAGDVDVSVDYTTADGTALQPGDYTATSGTLNIAAGSNSGTITVPIIADAVVESDETFTMGLSNIVTTGLGAFTKDTGIGTITNDDIFQISINDQTVAEDSGLATFTVTLLAAGDVDVSVDYATADGSAVQPGDYGETSGTLTIGAGSTSGTIIVPIMIESVVEADETFTIGLSNIVTTGLGAFIDDTGLGTITNDDTYQISIDDPVVAEDSGNMAFAVTLNLAGELDVSVDYVTTDGSATQPGDYSATSGTLNIAAGSNSGTINVPLFVDAVVEDDETFTMTLSNISGAPGAFIKDTGTGTISNDDLFGITAIDGAAVEGTDVTFEVTLGADTDIPLTVTYDAFDGSATVADSDYTDAPGSVTFPAGSLTGTMLTFTVATTADLNLESDEDFSVTVSSGHVAFDSNDAIVIGTILNNDHEITFIAGVNGQLDVGGTLYATYTEVIETGNSTSTVDAVPDPTFNFIWWDGVPPAWMNADPLTFGPVTGPMIITANFLVPPVIQSIGNKGGDLSPVDDVIITTFPNLTQFTITPNPGWCIEDVLVDGVSQGIITSYDFINVVADRSIEALFREQWKIIGEIEPYTARTLYGGAGMWRAYDTATSGANFDTGWTDHLQNVTVPSCGTTDLTVEFQPQAGWETPVSQTITLSADTTVTGWYKPLLTVVSPNGTVTSTQPGINCGGDCTEYYGFNTMVELTALPALGYIFKEFQGQISTTASPTLVIVDKPLTITAVYELATGTNVDNDLDGWSIDDGDCNDANPGIRPGAQELCDTTDWDCDGMTNFTTPIDPDCISTGIADIPLDTQLQAAPANIMFVLDDSGSMDWEFIIKGGNQGVFEGKRYVFGNPGDNVYSNSYILNNDQRAKWRSQWSGFNRMYYNPSVEYKPWPNGDGTRFPNADMDDPLSNPESSAHSLDMSANFLTSYLGADGYGDDCAGATPVNDDTTYSAKIETPGTWDYYTISVNQGGRITAYTTGGTDTYGYLYDASCVQIQEDDDDGAGDNMRLRTNISAGVYIIAVRHYDLGYGSGDYNFRINLDNGSWAANIGNPPGPATITLNPAIINAHYFTTPMVDTDSDGEWDLDMVGNPIADPSQVYLVHLDDPTQINYYKVTDSSGVIAALTLLDPVADAAEIALIKPSVRERATYADRANPTDAEMSVAERQNFVNWYSFYRRRELTTKAAVGEVVDGLKGVSVGYFSLNHRLIQQVLKVRVSEQDGSGNDIYIDNTQALLHQMYGLDSSGGTPLRRALRDVGRYFDHDDGNDGGVGPDPWYTDTSGECQQSFAIVMTDGYYNGGSPGINNNPQGDGPVVGFTDPAGDEMFSDSYGNTLADVAMYFYKNDIHDSLANRVPTNFIDDAEHQHMVTYSVSFGVFGSLNPDDYDLYNSNTALRDYPVWPDPSSGYIEKVDDMWHAAVNGRGMFLSADNPDTLVSSLQEVMLNLTSRIGSGASLTVNGEELHAGTTVFQAKYSTDGWVGDVQAFNINQISGEVITGDGNAIWSASEMLGEGSDWNTVSWDTDREIATYDADNDLGIPFRWTGITAADRLTAQQKIWLSDDPLTGAVDDDGKGELRLKYLRGDNSEEKGKGGEFRTRYSKLGDIVHSSPVYVNYGAYGVIYGGANDGMLHAFNADTGLELFAYVPNLSFQYLHQLPLAEPDFKHRFYVDQTATVKDTGDTAVAGNLGKILVGGLGKGGKGYFCLDVNTPLLNDESTADTWVKWEYPTPTSPAAEIDSMGFSFSGAFVVRSYDPAHKWVVIFGNGYSSTSGTAALYVLDADTGALLTMLDTGTAGQENGMSTPIPVDIDSDNKVDFVYAGDLNGNVWKFDLRDPDHTNWRSFFGTDALAKGGNANGIVDGGETVQPLFTAQGRERETDGTYVSAVQWDQPITTRPAVIRLCETTKAGYLVIFGTGQQLGQADANNTEYQTVYAVWDYGDDPDDYLGEFKRGVTPELTNQNSATTTLLEQVVDYWGPNPFNINQMLRVLSDRQPDWQTFNVTGRPQKNAGWYFDLPLSKERVIREIVIRDNKLIFISSIPENDPCAAGGKSIVHELDACTGGRLQTAQFDINGDGKIDENDMIKLKDSSGNDILDGDGNPIWVAPTGIMFDSMMYPPIFLKMGEEELKHFSTSAGNVMSMKEKSEQTGMFYWRQIDRQ